MVEVQDLLFYFEVAPFFFRDAANALVDDIRSKLIRLYFKYFVYQFLEQCYFSAEVLIFVVVVHHLEHFPQLLVPVYFLTFESQVKSKLSQAACA